MITRLRNVKPTRQRRKHAQAAHNNDGGVLTVVPGVRACSIGSGRPAVDDKASGAHACD